MHSSRLSNILLTWTYFLLISYHCARGDKLIDRIRAKLNHEPVTPPATSPPVPTTVDGVIALQLGGTVQTKKYDNQLYQGLSGGPVASGDDLECNFRGFCCWDNVASPVDQFDWTWATGKPDPNKLMANFGTLMTPNYRFLMAARTKTSATVEAMFISCSITCTTRPIKIKFKHWTTQGVQLQVCSSETFFNENNKIILINCKDVNRVVSPGPSTITIPPGEFLDIVFVASNFQSAQGGVAIIDDIEVEVTPCADRQQGSGKPGQSAPTGKGGHHK